MIPLRDANPTRRTPYMTLAIIVACFLGYAWERQRERWQSVDVEARPPMIPPRAHTADLK